jgi:RNA recognition motif-containing protein
MSSRGTRGFDDNTSSKDESATLFLGGLSYRSNEDTIKKHFSRYGTILNIRLAVDKETGKPKG